MNVAFPMATFIGNRQGTYSWLSLKISRSLNAGMAPGFNPLRCLHVCVCGRGFVQQRL